MIAEYVHGLLDRQTDRAERPQNSPSILTIMVSWYHVMHIKLLRGFIFSMLRVLMCSPMHLQQSVPLVKIRNPGGKIVWKFSHWGQVGGVQLLVAAVLPPDVIIAVWLDILLFVIILLLLALAPLPALFRLLFCTMSWAIWLTPQWLQA